MKEDSNGWSVCCLIQLCLWQLLLVGDHKRVLNSNTRNVHTLGIIISIIFAPSTDPLPTSTVLLCTHFCSIVNYLFTFEVSKDGRDRCIENDLVQLAVKHFTQENNVTATASRNIRSIVAPRVTITPCRFVTIIAGRVLSMHSAFQPVQHAFLRACIGG